MKALVTGGTGFIGSALVGSLDAARVLSRDPARAKSAPGVSEAFAWDAGVGPPPTEAVEGVDAIFHLAGDPVAEGRWTAKKKARIRSSRVDGTRRLLEAVRAAKSRPKVLVGASAVGIYGDRGDEELTEGSFHGTDFLAKVCEEWEAEERKAADLGLRVVHLRIGVVLGPGGGALKKMLPPFRMGVGGPLGSGKQWMPWVHRDDVVSLAIFAAENAGVSGPVNAVAPGAATNGDFTRALGRVLHRPAIFPVPKFAMKVAFGEFADILFASQRVAPRAALAAGYRFRHADVEGALRDAVG
jgi:hypothetical protein